MGAALWRRAALAEAQPATPDYLPPALPGCLYRIEVFGEPRAPWRSSPTGAMRDAIRLDLASWDEIRQEHFLAVPVDMRIWMPEDAA